MPTNEVKQKKLQKVGVRIYIPQWSQVFGGRWACDCIQGHKMNERKTLALFRLPTLYVDEVVRAWSLGFDDGKQGFIGISHYVS